MFNKIRKKLANFKNVALVFFPDNKMKIEVIRIGNHYQKKYELKQITISGLVLVEEVWKKSKRPSQINRSTSKILVPASFEDAKKVQFESVLHVRDGAYRDFLVYRGRDSNSVRQSDNNGGETKP